MEDRTATPFDYTTDLPMIEAYNARRSPRSKTRIQTHMGPELSGGDPTKARVVLLLNNPGYGPDSRPEEHALRFDGWPLAGLHPDAPASLRAWYRRPFGHVIQMFGEQHVARTCCVLQINPWASEAFDLGLVLPSRAYHFEVARRAAERGAIIVIGRSVSTWASVVPKGHVARVARNPRLSPGCLSPEGWTAVEAALVDAGEMAHRGGT